MRLHTDSGVLVVVGGFSLRTDRPPLMARIVILQKQQPPLHSVDWRRGYVRHHLLLHIRAKTNS